MGDEKVKEEAMRMIGMFQVLPRLVVFDLDYTLWPFYCECRSKREMPSMYPHVKGIIAALKDKGIDLAIASRSPTADIANAFLDKLNIKSVFVAKEIFSSWTHKTDHFQRIQSRTGNPFNSVLFFDDEDRNIQAVSECDNQKKPEKRFVTLEEIGKRNTSAGNTVDGTQLDAEIAGPENINVTIYSFYILKQYKKVTYPIPTNDSVQFVYLICNMITKCLMLEKEKDGAKGTGKKATIKY